MTFPPSDQQDRTSIFRKFRCGRRRWSCWQGEPISNELHSGNHELTHSVSVLFALPLDPQFGGAGCDLTIDTVDLSLDIIYHQRFPRRIRSYRLRQLLCPGRCPVSSTLGWSDLEADCGLCSLARLCTRIGHGRWDYRQSRTLGYRRSRRLRVSTSCPSRHESNVPRHLNPY